MEKLFVEPIDECFVRVRCEPYIAQELSDHFTFTVPGAQFMPAVRNKVWDGKIRLYSMLPQTIYKGLIGYVLRFAEKRNYKVEISKELQHTETLDDESIDTFLESLRLPFTPRQYQIDAFKYAIENERGLLLSPTASGKSFIIYLITQWFKQKRKLVIVPTTSLVYQMRSDFISYGASEDDIHIIMAGCEKNSDTEIVVTTWQSIYKMPKSWFSNFDVVIGDEAHLFKAKSLTTIMTNLAQCKYRFGFTGTLDGTQTHKLVLEGLFGEVKKVTTTAQLIEDQHLSPFKIKCLILQYKDEDRRLMAKKKYHEEMDFIVRNEARNKFTENLTLSLKGNTLILFQFVDKHGKVIFDSLSKKVRDGRKVFFVHGGVDGVDRENIRKIVAQESDAIIVASYGTFSTGINIPEIHNIIFASPSKSLIRVLQSIGRGLRKSSAKEMAVLYDISDDLSWKENKNHTLKHFAERIKIYTDEQFEYRFYPYKL
jgi:superfamily II DNA or RNA helicase